MRVVVTQIESGGTIKRRTVDTAVRSDALQWEELAGRALAVPLPYRPAPGGAIYHLRVGERDLMVAEHDLAGPLRDLVTAVMTLGDAVLATEAPQPAMHPAQAQARGLGQGVAGSAACLFSDRSGMGCRGWAGRRPRRPHARPCRAVPVRLG